MDNNDVLTPEAWSRALVVLRGDDGKSQSIGAASKAAGVTRRVLLGWVDRSREMRVDDDAWIHCIAQDFDESADDRFDTAEDKLFEMGVNGETQIIYDEAGDVIRKIVKPNSKALLAYLGKRDEGYKSGDGNKLLVLNAQNQKILENIDDSEWRRKLDAFGKDKLLKESNAVDGVLIEGDKS